MNTDLTAWNRLKRAVLPTQAIRDIDRLAVDQYGMHSLVLMENAAIACARWLRERFESPRTTAIQTTTILCGRGNNGGDGLAIARHLANCGWPCRIILLGPVDQLSSDSAANLRILTANGGLPVQIVEDAPAEVKAALAESSLIVDAMLGSGAKGNPRPPLDTWIRWANDGPGKRVAIDIPSGVDADTGDCGSPTFHAHCTLTFVARKPAMQLPRAESLFGEIQVMPIGIPAQLMAAVLNRVNSSQE